MFWKVSLNWMAFVKSVCICFDHEIILEGMKEEINQQRCTIGAHWCTNNLLKNRASKMNVDVVDKKVNSKTKLSTGEVRVPRWRPIIRPEGAKIVGSNEAFFFHSKNSFQKIMKLLFKLGMWKASVKRNGVLDCHVNNHESCYIQGLELSDEIINCFRWKVVLFVETIPFINLAFPSCP